MKRTLHITALFMAFAAFSCIKEEAWEENPSVDYEGREITVNFGVEMPEPPKIQIAAIRSQHREIMILSMFPKELMKSFRLIN